MIKEIRQDTREKLHKLFPGVTILAFWCQSTYNDTYDEPVPFSVSLIQSKLEDGCEITFGKFYEKIYGAGIDFFEFVFDEFPANTELVFISLEEK